MTAVVGEGRTADRVVAALDGGRRLRATEAVEAEAEPVVAAGEAALIDLVSAGVDVPVVPVAVAGLPSTTPEALPDLLDSHRAGRTSTATHPLLTVSTGDGRVGTAGFDVMLVRSEPGRISEFGLTAGGARGRFRADGVVVATPAGSGGYAAAAGGPHLEADAAAVAVVPVAAFGLGAPTWVVDPDGGVELRVERDEGAVSLLLDGRERGRLAGPSTVELARGGSLRTLGPIE